jgi:hypothetical protein
MNATAKKLARRKRRLAGKAQRVRDRGRQQGEQRIGDLAAALARLRSHSGALFGLTGCAAQLEKVARRTTEDGGQYVAGIIPSAEFPCCGLGFAMIATVSVCDDPHCEQDHRACARHFQVVEAAARFGKPGRVRVSKGWAGSLTGDGPAA